MKTTCALTISTLLLGLSAQSHAQNYPGFQEPSPNAAAVAFKAEANPAEEGPVIHTRSSTTLEAETVASRQVESVVDLNVLNRPSPYRSIAVGTKTVAEIPAANLGKELAVVSATYRESGTPGSDCENIALSVEQQARLDPSMVLQTIEKEIGTNANCACEIVKAAIKSSDADVEMVVAIVEVAITAAPESMRMVSQCAIATNPEALPGIQALLARYDSNAGDSGYSSKGAKSAKYSPKQDVAAVVNEVAAMPNPLNFPDGGPVGPTPGGPGGTPVLPLIPPVIAPPSVTDVDPLAATP